MNPFLESLLDTPWTTVTEACRPAPPVAARRGQSRLAAARRRHGPAGADAGRSRLRPQHRQDLPLRPWPRRRAGAACQDAHVAADRATPARRRRLGATVANLQQAAVLLRAGVRRLMLGNEIGGLASGARLGQLLAAYPDARLLAFADSADTVRALAAAAGKPGGQSTCWSKSAAAAGARDARRARHPGCRAGPGRQAVAGRRGHLRARSPRPTPRPRAAISRP